MTINGCCESFEWEFVADAGHADGCDFTLGVCRSCRASLINLFHVAAVNVTDNNVVVSQEIVDEIQRLEGQRLKEFMRSWYRALEADGA